MSRLLAAFQLDENVSSLIAALLRNRNIEAWTTLEAGLIAASDPEQLAFATANQRVLLTHNRNDFLELHEQYLRESRPHCGIVIARKHPSHETTRRLLALADVLTADEFENQLLFV